MSKFMGRQIDSAEIIARLEAVAAGRREYAESAPDEMRAVLLTQATAFDNAVKIAAGDLGPLYGLLPSWRWTSEMDEKRRWADSEPVEGDE